METDWRILIVLIKNELNLETYVNDSRLTEPSDGVRFEWRKMIEEVKRLGRPLTNEETERFKIK